MPYTGSKCLQYTDNFDSFLWFSLLPFPLLPPNVIITFLIILNAFPNTSSKLQRLRLILRVSQGL